MGFIRHATHTREAVAATLLGAALATAGVAAPLPLAGLDAAGFSPITAAYADEAAAASRIIVVHNGTQTTYSSLDEALKAATAGDTVKLDSTVTVSSPITIDTALTLDLAGHNLTINAAAKGKSGAIRYTGDGTLALTDSANSKGSLDITLGAPRETGATTGVYQGIAATGSSSVALSGIKANVTYTGASNASSLPTPTLYGIGVADGSVTLTDGASLTVTGAEKDNAFGACSVEGIHVSGSSADSKVTVSSDSSLHAVSNAQRNTYGHMQVPDTTQTGLSYTTVSDLMQIFPAKDSQFYQEICEKFKQQAEFDDSAETSFSNDSSNDSEMYYVTPLVLDSGVAVWAFSDPVTSDKGSLDNVVPTRFFVQSYYETPTSAVGIGSTTSFAGSVQVAGTVAADCANGNAYALDAKGASTWTVDTADALSQTHGSETYRARGSAIDPTDYFDDFSGDEKKMPGLNSSRLVYNATPQGAPAKVGEDSTVTIGGTTQEATPATDNALKTNGLDVDDEKAADIWKEPDLTITFSGIRDAQGDRSEKVADTKAAFGKTLKSSGIDLPETAATYTVDGTTYRFVGWSNNGTVYNADAVQNSLLMNGTMAGATTGNAAVTLTATYVAVGAGEHLVTFNVQDTVLAYAVKDGAAVRYADAGGRSTTPDAVEEDAGYDYTFTGWRAEGESKTVTELPDATADAVYTAMFDKEPTDEPVALRYRNAQGSWVTTSGLTVPYWTITDGTATRTDLNAVADAYAQKGTVIKTSTQVYTFTGWGPRLTDTAALYAPGELPAPIDYDYFGTESNQYFAKYDTAARTVKVTFIVDGKTYAKTAEAVDTSTDFDEVLAGTGKKNPDDKSKTQKFLGWSLKKNAKTPTIGKTNAATLSAVVKTASDSVKLYAVYGSSGSSASASTTTKHKKAASTSGTTAKTKTAKTKTAKTASATKKHAKPKVSSVTAASAATPHAATAAKPTAASAKTAKAKKAAAVKAAKAKKAKAAAQAKAKAAKAKQKDDDAAATTQAGDTGSGSDDGSASTLDNDLGGSSNGNVIGFAAVVAVAAAILGRAIWFFVKRRRGEGDDDEDTGIMADNEKVSF